MKDDRYITLIYKSLKGEASPEEQKALDQWSKDSDNLILRDRITEEWTLSENYQPDINVDVASDFAKLKGRVQQAKTSKKESKVIPMKPK